MNKTLTQTPATSGQVKQIPRVGQDAVSKMIKELTLSKEAAQCVHARGNELAADISLAVRNSILNLLTPSRYVNEEVRSSYTYPDEYQGPKPINDQIKAIAKIFGLDPSHALEFAKTLPELPNGAEGWFAIPSVDALAAKHFPEVTDQAEKYCQAVQLVHAKIADSRSFYNYRKGQITPAQLRVHARTAHALDLIA